MVSPTGNRISSLLFRVYNLIPTTNINCQSSAVGEAPKLDPRALAQLQAQLGQLASSLPGAEAPPPMAMMPATAMMMLPMRASGNMSNIPAMMGDMEMVGGLGGLFGPGGFGGGVGAMRNASGILGQVSQNPLDFVGNRGRTFVTQGNRVNFGVDLLFIFFSLI